MPEILQPHALTATETSVRLGVDPAAGLTAGEAAARLAAHGANVLPEAEHRPLWMTVLRQFASPLIYLLLAAAVIAFAMGHTGDGAVILVVLSINAAVGAIQEGRAERSMEALRKLSVLKVRCLRGGREEMLEASALVPGDVLLLAAGDAVGADARIVEAAFLEASESALTGESLPVMKNAEPVPDDTPLADRHGMLYAGTHVSAGRGRAIVTATPHCRSHRFLAGTRHAIGTAHPVLRAMAGRGCGRSLRYRHCDRSAAWSAVSRNPHGGHQSDGQHGAGRVAGGHDDSAGSGHAEDGP
jgi:magnesium-transporting ATPase (P-type)